MSPDALTRCEVEPREASAVVVPGILCREHRRPCHQRLAHIAEPDLEVGPEKRTSNDCGIEMDLAEIGERVAGVVAPLQPHRSSTARRCGGPGVQIRRRDSGHDRQDEREEPDRLT